MRDALILSIACADRRGIVARVAGYLADRGANILDAQQYNDASNNRFFVRIEFDPLGAEAADIEAGFVPIADELALDWRLRSKAKRGKVIIMVSKFDHCLVDLLYRQQIGDLNMDVVGIISNHPQPPGLNAIPFHYLPVTPSTKHEQEAKVRAVIDESGAELVILARYMQILSDEMARYLSGRCINIHHSFLPGFKGARPYHQAHERGVKMIGATSHYVTADLDEGPIIAQDVEAISHRDTPEELVARGRDVERRVLARAVRAHLEDRIFLNGHRTVVFD